MDNYINLIRKILNSGVEVETRSGKCRMLTHQVLSFDMENGFPRLPFRYVPFKSVAVELEGFIGGITSKGWYQERGCKFWDGWANPQEVERVLSTFNDYHDSEKYAAENIDDLGPIYGWQWRRFGQNYNEFKRRSENNLGNFTKIQPLDGICDQLNDVLKKLKDDPHDRRMQVSSVNPEWTPLMALPACFLSGVKVTTSEGYKPIEDIKIGDLVLTDSGDFSTVNNLYKTEYMGNLIKIKRKYGLDITSTPNHEHLIRDKGYMECCKIQAGDYLGIPIPKFDFEKPCDLTEDLMWFFGYFVGDGWVNHDLKKDSSKINRFYLAISFEQEEEVVKKIQNILGCKFYKGHKSGNSHQFQATSVKYADILRSFGHFAHNKQIPTWLFSCNDSLIESFLKGYEEADGCRTNQNRLAFTTTSENLALGLQLLHAKIGLELSIHLQERKNSCIIQGRKVAQKNLYHCYRTHTRIKKSNDYFFDGGFLWTKVCGVEETINDKKILVYNFSVNESHNYTINNTSTHNCHNYWKVDKIGDKLDLFFHMRSWDVYLGGPANIQSYSILLHLLAKHADLKPGKVTVFASNAHLYENLVPQCYELLNRPEKKLPTIEFTHNDFWDWDHTKVNCVGYEHSGKLEAEVSI